MEMEGRMCHKLTVHLYEDLLTENFHARTTVFLVAHLTVKFFGTSVARTNKYFHLWLGTKKKQTNGTNTVVSLERSSGLKKVSVAGSCDWL